MKGECVEALLKYILVSQNQVVRDVLASGLGNPLFVVLVTG
jgi:hypothetical protein